jgi:hypothetical protein
MDDSSNKTDPCSRETHRITAYPAERGADIPLFSGRRIDITKQKGNMSWRI